MTNGTKTSGMEIDRMATRVVPDSELRELGSGVVEAMIEAARDVGWGGRHESSSGYGRTEGTDPLSYLYFDSLYDSSERRPEIRLILIGGDSRHISNVLSTNGYDVAGESGIGEYRVDQVCSGDTWVRRNLPSDDVGTAVREVRRMGAVYRTIIGEGWLKAEEA